MIVFHEMSFLLRRLIKICLETELLSMIGNQYTRIESKFKKIDKTRIRQWDIFLWNKDIGVWWINFLFPFITVLSQDCDLSQDYDCFIDQSKQDKGQILEHILICPCFFENDVLSGTYISRQTPDWRKENRSCSVIGGEWKRRLKGNADARFYYIEEYKQDGISLPAMVMDFKFFLTVPRDLLYASYSESYVCSLSEIFREGLSQKFANYISRIWLPVFPKVDIN